MGTDGIFVTSDNTTELPTAQGRRVGDDHPGRATERGQREQQRHEDHGEEPRRHAAVWREPLWRELVGDELRLERREQQRTLQDVSERAGISPQYLSEVERGLKDPSSEMLASICGALGLHTSELIRRCGWQAITLGSSLATFGSTAAPTCHRPRTSGPFLMAA